MQPKAYMALSYYTTIYAIDTLVFYLWLIYTLFIIAHVLFRVSTSTTPFRPSAAVALHSHESQ